MAKSTKNTPEAEVNNQKYYTPNEDLVNWIRKRLEIEQERKSFEKGKSAGEKLPNSFYKKLNESSARKTEILDKIVFQSMANLIYFFEALAISPSLNKLFEKDVKNLLDPRYAKDNAKSIEMGMHISSYQFRTNTLARLISSALALPNDKDPKKLKNFRVAILYQLQSIIRDNIERLIQFEYFSGSQIVKSVREDFNNTMGWMAFIAKSISDEIDKENERQIGFMPIWISNKVSLHNFKFN